MMREKLIALIKARIDNKTWCVSELADTILADGWRKSSLGVGETVFLLLEKLTAGYDIVESKCVRVEQTVYGTTYSIGFPCLEIGNTLEFDDADVGITIFFTREEAEKEKNRLMEDWSAWDDEE